MGDEHIHLIHDIHISLLYLFIDEYEEGSKFDIPRENGNIFYIVKNLKEDFPLFKILDNQKRNYQMTKKIMNE